MTSASWPSPVRAIDSRSLTSIPKEIYFEIFDCVEYVAETSPISRKELLSNLALVCHLFCALALPRIFKSLIFVGDPETTSYDHTLFCRAIIKGEESPTSLARHVRKCELTSWGSEKDLWVGEGLLGTYGRAIELMPNIQEVALDYTAIGKRLFKVVCSLKSLESLIFHSCDFDSGFTNSFLRKMTPLKVKSFTFDGIDDRYSTKALSHMVSAERLERLQSDSWPVTSKLLSGIDQTVLLHLNITVDDWAALCSLLDSSPRLEKLEVDSPNDFGKNQDRTVAKTSCRNLHTLKCPPSMLYLVSGRPLHTIMITDIKSGVNHAPPLHPAGVFDIALLKTSTTEIRELHVSYHLCRSEQIYQNFPNLQVLCIVYGKVHYAVRCGFLPSFFAEFRGMIEEIVTHRPPATSITEFYIDFGDYGGDTPFSKDRNQQLEMLNTSVNKHFPNIKVVSFTGYLRWRKDPHKQTWETFFPLDDY